MNLLHILPVSEKDAKRQPLPGQCNQKRHTLNQFTGYRAYILKNTCGAIASSHKRQRVKLIDSQSIPSTQVILRPRMETRVLVVAGLPPPALQQQQQFVAGPPALQQRQVVTSAWRNPQAGFALGPA